MSVEHQTSVTQLNDDTELSFSTTSQLERYIDEAIYIPDMAPNSGIHYNLRILSYSSLLSLHSCPRRFELNRLLPQQVDVDDDNDAAGHLDFGTVVGNGIQELLVSGSIEKAVFRTFLDWNDNIESERGLKSKKTLWHAIYAVQQFQSMINGPLSQYKVAEFRGVPATELGFIIDCGDGFAIRGKLDALMVHKFHDEFLPLECKTTGMYVVNEAMYGNSSQGTGYKVVIDRVAHESEKESSGYDVFYPVYKTRAYEWDAFRFPKTNTSMALWLQSILMDIQDIQKYHDMGYFPQRGESCFSFNRPCKWYGLCHMDNEHFIGDQSKIPVKYDKQKDYPLRFSIMDLVEAQVEK